MADHARASSKTIGSAKAPSESSVLDDYAGRGSTKSWRRSIKRQTPFNAYLEIRPIILGDVRTVALRQHHYLLLDILDLIFRLLEIDDLDGHDLLAPVVDTLEDLPEATLPDPFLFRKYQLGVHLLQQRESTVPRLFLVIRVSFPQ